MARKRETKARALAAALEALYAKKADEAEMEPAGKKALKKPSKRQVGGFTVGAIKGGRS